MIWLGPVGVGTGRWTSAVLPHGPIVALDGATPLVATTPEWIVLLWRVGAVLVGVRAPR